MKHVASLADLARLFKLPQQCSKAVIILEAGKAPIVHLRRWVCEEDITGNIKLISESFDLVPRKDAKP